MTVLNLRPAVRTLLVDPEDRVLLCRWAFGLWGLPGGGIDPGEDHRDAVRRELREEVGLELDDPGPCVAHRVHVWDGMTGWDGQEEWYYLARVPAFAPRGTFTDEQLVAEDLVELRWLTLPELRALPSEPTTTYGAGWLPRWAVEFTERLVHHGHPDVPVELPV